MKSTGVLSLFAACISISSAIDLEPRSDNPRVIGLDIEKRTIADIVAHDNARLARLTKRQSKHVEQTIDNLQTLYYANLTLGTPAQQIRAHIDTGSSDLWVNAANSTFCLSRYAPCVGGTYDASRSTSHRYINNEFNISYVDGSGASGDYVSDTMSFGGVQLQNFQFGIGELSTSQQGVLGIGYPLNEVQVQVSGDSPYPNLPVALTNGGFINRNAYSLWLNDLDSSTGKILFGGVDTKKYQGTLRTVPVYRQYGQYYQFIIAMSSFGFNGSTISSNNLPSPVLLDSGSTLSRLPDDIVSAIYQKVGIVYDSSAGVGLGYCDLKYTNAYLDFGFSGINIQVPFNELFLNAGTDSRGRPLTFPNGRRACLFGIAPSQGIIPILGDTFLRSAYVVYDLVRNEISLAQTVFNTTESDIREIASGTATIPGASPAPSTVLSLALGTATDGARLGAATGTFTALNANPTGMSGGSSGSSSNAAYPTKVPYLVGAAMVAGAGLLL